MLFFKATWTCYERFKVAAGWSYAQPSRRRRGCALLPVAHLVGRRSHELAERLALAEGAHGHEGNAGVEQPQALADRDGQLSAGGRDRAAPVKRESGTEVGREGGAAPCCLRRY